MTKISNMNYYYNKQYFDELITNTMEGDKCNENIIDYSYSYSGIDDLLRPDSIGGLLEFELTTLYPGLLMGLGYLHDIKSDDAIKCGFSFDYVSGLPYLPGSSLKGMLRSYFPDDDNDNEEISNNKESYIKSLLSSDEEISIGDLKTNIFDGGDIFFDVFPTGDNTDKILNIDFITPHNEELKNPIPIKLIKVNPNVTFNFCFNLKDYCAGGKVIVNKEAKLEMFKQIILDMGIGAKTNVGFGKLQEGKSKQKMKNDDTPKCKKMWQDDWHK